jgi:hypothetical protein
MAIVTEAADARKGQVDHAAHRRPASSGIIERFDRQMSVFTTSALVLDDPRRAGVIDPRAHPRRAGHERRAGHLPRGRSPASATLARRRDPAVRAMQFSVPTCSPAGASC